MDKKKLASPDMEEFQKKLEILLNSKSSIKIEGPETTKDLSYVWVEKNDDLRAIEEGLMISNFAETMKKRNIEMEFRLLRRITETQFHNDALEDFNPNANKLNRYANIIPFSHSKVTVYKFKSERDEADEYINANYLNTDLGDSKKFIATQGPLPNTFQNLWKMIWTENVNLVIMLCNLKENGKSQCDQYWPKDVGSSMEFPLTEGTEKELRVKLEKEDDKGKNIVSRSLLVERLIGSTWQAKKVEQVQWMGWPDHGVPTESDHEIIQSLLDKMTEYYVDSDASKRMVVHCSAGVGRTGTLISLFTLSLILNKYRFSCKTLEKPGSEKARIKALKNVEKFKNFRTTKEIEMKHRLSVFGTVRRLREQRWGMVNNSDQYLYIYNFMVKAIENILK